MPLRWIALVPALTLGPLAGGRLAAHDWYPLECCHGMDCAPVDRVDGTESGGMTVTSRLGTARVPPSMARRESKDNQMHVCMRPNRSGAMQVICIFVPPQS